MAKKIIFKTLFNRGAKGKKGDRGINYIVPVNGIIAYDGDTVPEGYIETDAPENEEEI